MVVTEEIGKWIYTEIKNQGKLIKEFAYDSQICEQTLWFWGVGRVQPRVLTLGLALQELGYEVYLNDKPFDLLDIKTEFEKLVDNKNFSEFARKHEIKYSIVKTILYRNNARLNSFLDVINKLGTLEVRKVA